MIVIHMETNKSIEEYKLIHSLLCDFNKSHGHVFNNTALRNTTRVVERRCSAEGISFLTKTLPRLGKALDRALSSNIPLDASKLYFSVERGSKLPRFLGEFFKKVFNPDGTVLQDPCAQSVYVIRHVCFVFYKYKLPYTDEQEQQVIDRFKQTEEDLLSNSAVLRALRSSTEDRYTHRRNRYKAIDTVNIAREARILLARVFSNLDIHDIIPKHGPGAVATKQQRSEKYVWRNVSSRITKHYPLDEFFYSSLGHVCDTFRNDSITEDDLPARVILVPKDSRGPRLISCEPVDFQWIQQGVMAKIVKHVESIKLTKFNVFFTDQGPNQRAALIGSKSGKYATIDLNEASDRVSLDLVRLLFPDHIFDVIKDIRTTSTVLPNGENIQLTKFAPMGSALCFPILALTVWAILSAALPDADARESILVYGDDVIVPTAYADEAIERLESFGLKANRDKSCTSGFFRESCGTDAFKGLNVTPVRFRTVWSSRPDPNAYVSWIAYANSAYDKRFFTLYEQIVQMLNRVYGSIPGGDPEKSPYPCLREEAESTVPIRRRWHSGLQKTQRLVRVIKNVIKREEINGWSMLLRFFTEALKESPPMFSLNYLRMEGCSIHVNEYDTPFSVREYTQRHASMLVWRWR